MAATRVGSTVPVPAIAARSTASVALTNDVDGFLCGTDGGRVRLLVTKVGTVTSANLRVYVRGTRDTGEWFAGVSTDEADPLAPATFALQARDLDVGENVEFALVLEAIVGGGTIAVDVIGVPR